MIPMRFYILFGGKTFGWLSGIGHQMANANADAEILWMEDSRGFSSWRKDIGFRESLKY